MAVFSSLLFLLFAVVDTAAGGDYADGKLGKALMLDGESQSVKIPHYTGLEPLMGITVSAWIKPERVTKGRDSWQMIYGKPERHGHGFMAIGEYEKKHSLYFELKMPGFGNRIRHGFPLEPATLLDGKWHLVCVTYDGKAMTFYADGQGIGVKAVKGQIDTQGKAPAYIGSKRGRSNHWRQYLDCVRERREPISDVASHLQAIDLCHMANLCIRLGEPIRADEPTIVKGRPLTWDPAKRLFVADEQASSFLKRKQRAGYEIVG